MLRKLHCLNGFLFSQTSPLARYLLARHSCSKLFIGVYCKGALSPSGQVEMMYVFLVAGLSYDTNETVLKDAFGQHGEIIEVKVICDHVSGKSKGYGFVHFTSETLATTALKEMDNKLLDGRHIRVHYADKG